MECRGKDAWWWHVEVPKHCPYVGSEPYWDLVNPLVGWVGGILKCSCLMAEVWLKPNPNRSDIAWVSFDLQEHKSQNNAVPVMDHLIELLCFKHCRDFWMVLLHCNEYLPPEVPPFWSINGFQKKKSSFVIFLSIFFFIQSPPLPCFGCQRLPNVEPTCGDDDNRH